MNLVTISLIVVPTLVIIMHYRYVRAIQDVRILMKRSHEESESVEERLLVDSRLERQKVEDLLHEIDELRKEIEELQKKSESELKLRLEAERRIELAIQENENAQELVKNIEILHKANIDDFKTIISSMSDEIVKKLGNNLNIPVKESITDKVANTLKQVSSKPKPLSKERKQFIADFDDLALNNGLEANKDYFIASKVESGSKYFLCDIAYLSKDNHLYIIDLKLEKYLDKYLKNPDSKESKQDLLKSLNKYFSYISNKKYLDNILSFFKPLDVVYSEKKVVVALANEQEISLLKDFGYDKKLSQFKIDVMDFSSINDLVL